MNIHIDADDKDYEVATYGGYYEDDGCTIDSFGIQIDEFTFNLTSKTAADLVKKLRKHLDANSIKYE